MFKLKQQALEHETVPNVFFSLHRSELKSPVVGVVPSVERPVKWFDRCLPHSSHHCIRSQHHVYVDHLYTVEQQQNNIPNWNKNEMVLLEVHIKTSCKSSLRHKSDLGAMGWT